MNPPDPKTTVTYSGWPEALKAHIQDVARRRSVRQQRLVSASEVALEWVLLGKRHAAPEPIPMPEFSHRQPEPPEAA